VAHRPGRQCRPGMSSPALPAPWSLAGGRATLAGVPLDAVLDVVGREGAPAAWVVDHDACAVALGRSDGLPVALIPQDELLALLAASGRGRARVYSRRDVERATRAGLDGARLVADGRVKDDGLLLAALGAGAGTIVCRDDEERDNLARIARGVGLAVPGPGGEVPPPAAAPPAPCGGLVARVLRPPPVVHLDAALPDDEPLALVPAVPGEAVAVRVAGLDGALGGADPRAAAALGTPPRGAWVAVPTGRALVRPPGDPSHPPLGTVLVRAGRVRWLDPSRP